MEWRLISVTAKLFSILRCCVLPRVITRNAVSLSYKILGEENVSEPDVPPLFILHGLLGMKRDWEGLGKTMLSTTKRTVVIVEQRNHGDSPHTNSHKYPELAEDVIQLLNKLSVQKALLVGHSMGGKTSMCVSLMAPQKVAGLLVVDISPASAPPQLVDYMPKVLAAMKTVSFHPKSIKKSKKRAKKTLKDVIEEEALMKAILSNIRVKSNGTIGWVCNLDILIKHFKYIASFPNDCKEKKYQGPTLFVGGQLSDYIPPDDLPKIRGYFPLSVVHYIPKAGHNLQVDDPKAFLEYVIAFSRSIEDK